MPRKVFVAGEILTAADVNTNLMDQAVMVFDDAAARTTAIPSPTEGMVTYLKDTDNLEKFDGTNFVDAAPGKILQVVSTAKTDTFSTSSTSFTDVTGLDVTITPSSTASKIMIVAQIAYSLASGLGWGHFKLVGGNTASYVGDSAGARISGVFGGFISANVQDSLIAGGIVYLDSPASSSAITYKLQVRQASAGSVFINRSLSDSDNEFYSRGASSITVMEVAG